MSGFEENERRRDFIGAQCVCGNVEDAQLSLSKDGWTVWLAACGECGRMLRLEVQAAAPDTKQAKK